MGLTEKIALGMLCAFVVLGVIQLFSAPLKLALKVLLNTLLGFAALFLLNLASGLTGFTLGLNLLNALTVGILGVPGLVLLVLLKLVFI
ncbi:MAG: pro-sigmaK processing inhibitor BofA family protein [Oscillospiraceae bacterium]|nr:pro-sigmaK processing inhibitor BofA family protein [Oscillospiraceae bacterium]